MKCRRVLVTLLVIIFIFQAIPATAVDLNDQTNVGSSTLRVFDLESFINTLPTSKIRYDYVKLATALQGLANRETPQLYFYFLDGDEAKQVGWDMDEHWLAELREEGGYLSNYTVVTVTDFWSLFSTFADCYDGIVLWDENVPATANVASTIAGVEDLLPVRYATGEDDLYTVMLTKGFSTTDVKRNLVGMFTGTGTIPDSTTASTGSAKDDAYIWAKEQYLDEGLTNPLLMTYSIDGSSWVFEDDGTAARSARFVSAALPTEMQPGEIVKVKITVENTGTETWTNGSYYRLGMTTVGTFGFYTDEEGTAGVTSNRDRLAITTDVAQGEQYTFEGYLKAPTTEGAYELGMGMILDGVEWFGRKYFHGITVAASSEEDSAETVVNLANDADIMMVGHFEAGAMTVRVKNTGSSTWSVSDDTDNGFFLRYSYGSTTLYAAPGSETVSGGNSAFVLDMSGAADDVEVTMQMVYRVAGVDTPFGDSYTTQSVDIIAQYDAQVIGVHYPERMDPGEKAEVVVEVMNLGTESWTRSKGYKLGTNYRQLSTLGDTDDNDRLLDRIQIETEIEVKTGDIYRFHFDLHSWILSTAGGTATFCIGSTDVKLQMINDAGCGWLGTSTTITPYFGYEQTDITGVSSINSDSTLGAEFVSCEMPQNMNPGEVVPIKFIIKNTGTNSWAKNSYYRLALKTSNGFGFYTDSAATAGVTGNRDRLYVPADTASGETVTITGYLKAPDAAGDYTITVDMILDGQAWFGAISTHSISVADEATAEETSENSSVILSALKNGDTGLSVWVSNNGSATWEIPETNTDGYFLRYTVNGVHAYASAFRTAADGAKTRFDLTDLPSAGSSDVQVTIQMVKRTTGVDTAFGDTYTYTIEAQNTALWDMAFLSLEIPESVAEGETEEAIVVVRNTGTQTWAETLNGVRLTLDKRVSSYVGTEDDEGKLGNRIRLENGITVEPGDVYLFHFDLHSRQSAEDSTSTDLLGTVAVKLQMLKEKSTSDSAYAWFTETVNISYTAGTYIREFTDEIAVNCDEVEDNGGYNAVIVSAALPNEMTAGEIVKVKFTVKNTGTNAIYCSANTSQGQKVGVTGFKIYTGVDKTSTDSGSFNRLKVKNSIATGQTYTFEGFIEAPTTSGDYTLKLQMVDEASGGVGWFGSTYEKTIAVVGTVDDGLVETPIVSSGIIYENLFNTALPNADYYIANKAFFWDLSPDATIAPIDDRTQPVGSDVATLKAILLAQAQQADAAAENGNGTGIYTVGGFVPWYLKYTSYADPHSSMEPVTAEWTMVEIISTYHGQTDADAFGTVGLSNASIFSHVPLDTSLEQNNDKGEDSTVVYDADTAYIMFFMGDWDGAAWVNGILPIIWEESQTDAAENPNDPIPLAWPINSCLADRIPQMYNMLYSTAGSADYFVTGDNGTGYLNPMFLEGEYVPTGLDNYLDEWVAHNVAANEKFDLDITGFLIEGTLSNSTGSTETVRQAYSQMTPYGVISSNAYDNIVVGDNTTPFPKMYSLTNMRTEEDRQTAANTIAGNIKFDGQFFVYRSVKASRANIRDTLELLEAQNPGIKYEVVDPYTYMELYAQYADSAEANVGAIYEGVQASPTVTIDGVVGTNEWTTADSMLVSATSQEITDHGFIWGSFENTADLSVSYRLKWDSNNLYLLEERTDNYIKNAYTEGATPQYDIDASMLFLDLDGVRDGAKFFTGDFAVHYSFDADNEPVVYLRTGTEAGDKNHTLLADGVVTAVRSITESGYVCEVAIPWSLLTNGTFSYSPSVNNSVGMTLLAIDHDQTTTGGRQIMWHGNGDTQDNWGVLKFVSEE